MTLTNKKRVYLSLNDDLIKYVDEQSKNLKITKSKYISKLLIREYELEQKRRIDKIIKGNNIY